MRPTLVSLFAGLTLASLALPATAGEVYVGYAKGLNDALIQSGSIASADGGELGVSLASPHYWTLSQPYDLNLRLELAASHLDGEHRGGHDEMDIWALRPVLRWQAGSTWFVDAGLGYAHLSDEQFEAIRMGSRDNFSIVVGAGWQLDEARRWSLNLRYNHFSNGYTSTPNPGLDYATTTLAYRF